MTMTGDTERFKRLPEAVPPEALRASHDPEPAHEEMDDQLREQIWFTNFVG